MALKKSTDCGKRIFGKSTTCMRRGCPIDTIKENIEVAETVSINIEKSKSANRVIDKIKTKKYGVQIPPEASSPKTIKSPTVKLKWCGVICILAAVIVISILLAVKLWTKELSPELNTDEDIISDPALESDDFDADGDGLSQKEEIENGTDPNLYDSDNDGLSDGEEVNNFHTNPSIADSDGDGLIDGIEIKIGLNPLKVCSDNVTNDAEKKLDYTFADPKCSLTVNGSAKVISSINVSVIDKNILANSDGVLGDIYSFYKSCEEEFAAATIECNYGEELQGINEDELCIFYLNEDTAKYERVPSVIDKDSNTISAQLSHFSLYILGQAHLENATFIIEYENIEDSDNEVKAVQIAESGFDLHKHSFAFHNFRSAFSGDGNCYGISIVAYLNYLGKLPRCGDEYDGIMTDGPAYTISDSSRFAANQLYLESESSLLNTENNYDVYQINSNDLSQEMIDTFSCIMHWQGKQHNFLNRFAISLDSTEGFVDMVSEISQGKPVILAIIENSLQFPSFSDADIITTEFYHYVLAYGIYRAENEIYVLVYDSNRPGEKCYIKMSEIFGIITSAKYGEYSNIRMVNVEIPTGPYVSHSYGMLSGKICEDTDSIKTIPNACIDIYKDGELFTSTVSTATGHYEVFLPAGEYSVKISAEGYNEFNGRATITVNETMCLESFLKNETEVNTSGEVPRYTGEYVGEVDTSGEAYFRKVLWDKSAHVLGGISTKNYCFEYIELQGNSPAYNKINKALYDLAETVMNTNRDGEGLVGADGGASYSAYSSVTYNRNGILCVRILVTEASFDANTYKNHISYTEQNYCFSLSTGDYLTLADLTEIDEETLLPEIRRIAWEGLCASLGDRLLDSVEDRIYNTPLEEFKFAIDEGEIILCFSPNEVASVADYSTLFGSRIPTEIYIFGSKSK